MAIFSALRRQIEQMRGDPVLRRWIWRRALRGRPVRPPITRRTPPYLNGANHQFSGDVNFPSTSAGVARPTTPIQICLPGGTISLQPEEAASFFSRTFADTESMLAAHRFAWVPLAGPKIDPQWVAFLWTHWAETEGGNNGGWPWHPYTTAERAINILSFAHRYGLPGEPDATLELLRRHCTVIADNLEYFGDTQTGNHLANNGRGLFLIGLALGLEAASALGAKILLQEADRIFAPSGILREGSSHYHLLLTRAYVECWLTAHRYQRPETDALRQIASKALAVIPLLRLPAGFPLIGDVSPDCPPAYLLDVLNGERVGWSGHIGEHADELLAEVLEERKPISPESLLDDGWIRHDHGPWAGLWYVAPDGWAPNPGHGHQDFGSFELDFGEDRVICDLGRRSYGPSGDQDVSADSHNTLTVDGQAAFPLNRAYYDDAYRRDTAGAPAHVTCDAGTITVQHDGFSRLSGPAAHRRSWQFDGATIQLSDELQGTGRHRIIRRFHTTLPIEQTAEGIEFGKYRFTADGQVDVQATQRWPEYGSSEPASVITVSTTAQLPWQSVIRIGVA